MVGDLMLPFRFSRRQVRSFLATIFAVNIAFMITTAIKYSNVVLPMSWKGWGHVFREALDLGAENNLAAWHSAITLLIATGGWLICYALDVRGRKSRGDRFLSWGWVLLAGLFCLLSLDEEGSFHERLGAVPGMNQFDVFVFPMVGVGLFLLMFAWARLRTSWLTLALLTLGFLTYLSVPIQERAEAVLEHSGMYSATWHTPTRDVVIEEGSELLGTLFFIIAGLVHARRLNRALVPSMPEDQWLDFDVPVDRPAIMRVASWIVGLMGFGLVVQAIAVPDLPHGGQFTASELGSPPDWFAASLMLIAAALFLYAARSKPDVPGQQLLRSFYKLFAGYAAVLAVHHGGGHFLSSILWYDTPRRQLASNVLLGFAALGVAAVGIRRLPERAVRLVLATWGLLAVMAAVRPEPLASVLLFAAYGLVLIVVAPIALAPPDLGPPRG